MRFAIWASVIFSSCLFGPTDARRASVQRGRVEQHGVGTIFFGDWTNYASDLVRNITLFNLRLARKKRQQQQHPVDIFILTYSDNKTDGMVAWGKRHNVKIFDFPTIPHLTRENVQTNQKWEKCIGNLLKIYLWSLTQYASVLYLDPDHFLLSPFSNAANKYMNSHGLVCWKSRTEPLNGGGFLLRPDTNNFMHLLRIVRNGFNKTHGWERSKQVIKRDAFSTKTCSPPERVAMYRSTKHRFNTYQDVCDKGWSTTWDFIGAGGDQGLLYYAFRDKVNCSRDLKPKSRHFAGHDKPWNALPSNISDSDKAKDYSHHQARVKFFNKIVRENRFVCRQECSLTHQEFG